MILCQVIVSKIDDTKVSMKSDTANINFQLPLTKEAKHLNTTQGARPYVNKISKERKSELK